MCLKNALLFLEKKKIFFEKNNIILLIFRFMIILRLRNIINVQE